MNNLKKFTAVAMTIPKLIIKMGDLKSQLFVQFTVNLNKWHKVIKQEVVVLNVLTKIKDLATMTTFINYKNHNTQIYRLLKSIK